MSTADYDEKLNRLIHELKIAGEAVETAAPGEKEELEEQWRQLKQEFNELICSKPKDISP